MNNSKYLAALTRLYVGDKMHVCKHPSCETLTLRDYCIKHDASREKIDEGNRRSRHRGNR
jgi:hypothetical protein